MKKIIYIITLLMSTIVFSQVGVNTTAPQSTLDIRAKNDTGASGVSVPGVIDAKDGILIPRVSSMGTIQGTQKGQLIYLTTTDGTRDRGFYFWTGTVWSTILDASTGLFDSTPDGWSDSPTTNSVVLNKNSSGGNRANSGQVVVSDDGSMIVGEATIQNPSAILELNSNSKGFLLPRLTSAQRDAFSNPVVGMMIFNTDKKCMETYDSAEKGWFNPCDPGYSNQKEAYFQFSCSNVSLFPTTLKIPVGTDVTASSGYAVKLDYTGGNGGTYSSGVFYSADPAGLKVSLASGNVTGTSSSPGTGSILMPITGRVNGLGSQSQAQVIINFPQFGQSCPVLIPLGIGSIASIDSYTYSLTKIMIGSYSGTSTMTLDYSGGDGGIYAPQTVNSTGVTGLTATLARGNFATGSSSVVFNITGSPTSVGTATFTGTLGGQTYTFTIIVDAHKRCLDIKNANPLTIDGVYKIDPDGTGTNIGVIDAQCDMTTDGGGWTLVLNYLHRGGTNPVTSAQNNKLPLLGSTTLGTDESSSATYWGHASPTLMNFLSFTHVRFYGKSNNTTEAAGGTPNNGRIIHFKTSAPSVINCFRGIGLIAPGEIADTVTYTTLYGDHTAIIPVGANNSGYAGTGTNAMIVFPFMRTSAAHWNIGGNRWEVDDFANSPNNSTYHAIWVK